MNNPPLIFLGLLVTFLASFGGLVLGPQMQIGRQVAVPDKFTGTPYPSTRPGFAAKGEKIPPNATRDKCGSRISGRTSHAAGATASPWRKII